MTAGDLPQINVRLVQLVPLELQPAQPSLPLNADTNTGATPIALPDFAGVDVVSFTVDGPYPIWFQFGTPSTPALTVGGGVVVPPGPPYVFSLSPQLIATCTHIFVVTRYAPSTATLNFFRRGT